MMENKCKEEKKRQQLGNVLTHKRRTQTDAHVHGR